MAKQQMQPGMPSASRSGASFVFVGQGQQTASRNARSHLAHQARKKRLKEQRQEDRESLKQESEEITLPIDENKTTIEHLVPSGQPAPSPLFHILPLDPCTMAKGSVLSGGIVDLYFTTLGVSSFICPGPQHVNRAMAMRSPAFNALLCAVAAFHCVKAALWRTEYEKKYLEIAVFTFRGDAIRMAREELFVNSLDSPAGDMVVRRDDRGHSSEIQFGIAMKLLLTEYRLNGNTQHHFAACRRLIRAQQKYESSKEMFVDSEGQVPKTYLAPHIRNPYIHHMAITFECVNYTSDSLIWVDSDVVYLEAELQQFLQRLVAAMPAISDQATYSSLRYGRQPEIPPTSLLWRCLNKAPGPLRQNIYDDISEDYGHLAALMLLCIIYLDYEEPATQVGTIADLGTDGSTDSVIGQCISDLEDSLIALGEDEALSNGLNVPWLMAGGIGIPMAKRKERLWSVVGMIYAIKRSKVGFQVADQQEVWPQRAENVRRLCKTFLGVAEASCKLESLQNPFGRQDSCK